MSLPKWAFPEASARLSGLREQGEGQNLEFKEDFPEQAHRVAKELAALATSGGGVLLIGVHNNGDVAGLMADTEEDRDKAIHRAQNMAQTVRPDMDSTVSPASDAGKFVLFIEIKDPSEPVYCHEGRPYIRVGRESRQATPDEVKDCVWAHASSKHKKRMEDLEFEQTKKQLDQINNIHDDRNALWNQHT